MFLATIPLSSRISVSDVTEPEPNGGNPGGGSLYTFGEADGGKLGLGKNVTSEADVPTRVDIPDESVSGNVFCLIRLLPRPYFFHFLLIKKLEYRDKYLNWLHFPNSKKNSSREKWYICSHHQDCLGTGLRCRGRSKNL